jgi:uncharacterized protein (TIGR02266 family)
MRREIEEALFSQAPETGADQREFVRVPVSLVVRYWTQRELSDRFIPVLGEGGLFVATAEPLPVGARINLEITLVRRQWSFKVQGQVVWVNNGGTAEQQGMGVRFVELTAEQRKVIHELVDGSMRLHLLERRRFARLDSRLPVQFLYAEGDYTLNSEDIGQGGMFIATDHLVAPREWLRLNLTLPDEPGPIKLLGEVVRSVDTATPGQPPGVGVKFLNLDTPAMAAIQRYLIARVANSEDAFLASSGLRCFPRIKRRLKVRVQAGGASRTAWCRDISLGGAFLQTPHPEPRGSQIELGLFHPILKDVLTLPARVVRALRPDPAHPHRIPGMGLTFDLSGNRREQLLRYLKDFVLIQSRDAASPGGFPEPAAEKDRGTTPA